MKNINTLKNMCSKFFTAIMVLMLIGSLPLKAQDLRSGTAAEKSNKYVLEVPKLITDVDAKMIADVLNDHPGKIVNYTIDKTAKKVTVFISDKLQVIDLLEIMDIAGYTTGYINEKNEFVQLGANGSLVARPRNKN